MTFLVEVSGDYRSNDPLKYYVGHTGIVDYGPMTRDDQTGFIWSIEHIGAMVSRIWYVDASLRFVWSLRRRNFRAELLPPKSGLNAV